MLMFAPIVQVLHVSLGEEIAHAMSADMRLIKSKIMSLCRVFSWRRVQTKSWTCILSPFGSNSIVIPKLFIWGRDDRIGTSPVSSTSTLVEHESVVGKWMIQLSQQVSVSELANTKDLLQRQTICRDATIQRMFLEPSDCRSWSNWPCAAKIQNNVCWMVGKVQSEPMPSMRCVSHHTTQ